MRSTEPLVHLRERAREETVARHGEPHAGLTELVDEQGRDHAHQRADGYPLLQAVQSDVMQGRSHRRGVAFENVERLNSR